MPMASDRPVREAENRLERFNADRERLLAEVERRVVARRVAEAKARRRRVARVRAQRRRVLRDQAARGAGQERRGRALARSVAPAARDDRGGQAERAARARPPLRPGRRRQLRSARLQVRDRRRAVAARRRCSRRCSSLREGMARAAQPRRADPRRRRDRPRARVRRARHDRRHADALVEHGLAGDRLRR